MALRVCCMWCQDQLKAFQQPPGCFLLLPLPLLLLAGPTLCSCRGQLAATSRACSAAQHPAAFCGCQLQLLLDAECAHTLCMDCVC